MNDFNHEPSDESLILEMRAGNKEAFVLLVRRYKHKVFSLAARFARGSNELDDICQEVFIKVYENLGKFRDEAPFEHWLTRITIRTCLDALRSRKKEKGNIPLDLLHDFLEDGSTDRRQAAREARDFLERGLARLRPEERLVITLLELEEKSIKEIAAMTGWGEAKVKIRAFRARQKLRELLEKQHGR